MLEDISIPIRPIDSSLVYGLWEQILPTSIFWPMCLKNYKWTNDRISWRQSFLVSQILLL